MNEQSGVASSKKGQLSMKKRDSVKLKENRKERKARTKGSSPESLLSELLALVATDWLELNLV